MSRIGIVRTWLPLRLRIVVLRVGGLITCARPVLHGNRLGLLALGGLLVLP